MQKKPKLKDLFTTEDPYDISFVHRTLSRILLVVDVNELKVLLTCSRVVLLTTLIGFRLVLIASEGEFVSSNRRCWEVLSSWVEELFFQCCHKQIQSLKKQLRLKNSSKGCDALVFFFTMEDSMENLSTFSSLIRYLIIREILIDSRLVKFFEIEIDCKKVLMKNIK